MRDLYNNVRLLSSLAIATRTASANGASIDRNAYNDAHSAMVVVITGAITDGTHTIEVQHSDDNSAWAAVADADLQGTEPAIGAANDDTIYEIGYLGGKRYLRVVSTVSGSPVTGGTLGAFVVLGHARVNPIR